jgi:hypothetical protein
LAILRWKDENKKADWEEVRDEYIRNGSGKAEVQR